VPVDAVAILKEIPRVNNRRSAPCDMQREVAAQNWRWIPASPESRCTTTRRATWRRQSLIRKRLEGDHHHGSTAFDITSSNRVVVPALD